ncbi:hypothetical protein [Streptomyces sp. SPB074]|uniref:hypothetical protein n=1 Tax=Streptomyces sp. (strain SPB074) TaxID=465543 RepID=UPI00017F2416|nr:hypothetical protein [Streptomyces sp. SPB074]EDY43843.1 conserved hypothetical protein [Streptomyces sp. SPB074]
MALFGRSDKQGGGKPGEWYYCLDHGKVEEGPQCPSKNRMGPYATRVEAEHAMDRAAERNRAWENDERWTDGKRPEGE